jgi:N-acetylglucosaminyl-diphospho-decaprenol L-rhamnosyltransferase
VTRLAILIVSFNAKEDLQTALRSLTDTPPSVTHQIVVVDNASTDGAPTLIRDTFPQVRLIDAGANIGFARANNLGIRATTSDLVLLLNPDTVVPPGAIDRLVSRLDARPDAAVVGPRIVDGRGLPEWSFGAAPTPWRELRRKAIDRLDKHGLAIARRAIGQATSREASVDWVSGACLLARRADLEAAGLFDERYFLYMEDVDLCAAIRARGRTVVFSPVAEIVHVRGRSGLTTSGAAYRAWQQSHLAYYRKHLPGWAPWLERYLRMKGLAP